MKHVNKYFKGFNKNDFRSYFGSTLWFCVFLIDNRDHRYEKGLSKVILDENFRLRMDNSDTELYSNYNLDHIQTILGLYPDHIQTMIGP